ncbi:MAG TPA: hypothetical protein VFV65_08250 [Gemmatimonadales bacterium]|nr:hypothetical protein [Gemmatimonadales bacterium]
MPILAGDAVDQFLEGVLPPGRGQDQLTIPDYEVDRRPLGEAEFIDEKLRQPDG